MAICFKHYLKAVPLLGIAAILFIVIGCTEKLSEEEQLDNAQAAIESNKSRTAIIGLKNLLTDYPNNADARLLLAKLYLTTGEPAAAEKELLFAERLGVERKIVVPPLIEALAAQQKYDAIIKIDPEGEGPAERAAILTEQAKAHFTLGNINQATEIISRAILLNPSSADASTTQAVLVATEDTQAALELIQKITSAHPTHASAWSVLGQIHRARNNPEDAESAFSQAINNRGTAADFLYRAVTRIEIGDEEGGQIDIDKARVLSPNYYELDFLQGLLDFKRGNLEEARASLQQAYANNNNFLPTLFYLATVDFNLGHLEEAEKLAANHVFMNPDYLPARLLLAKIYFTQGNHKSAEATLAPALKSAPENIAVLSQSADIFRAQGRREEELETLNKIDAQQAGNEHVGYRLGSALLSLGRDQLRATKLLEGYLSENPSFYQAAQDLVAYYSKTKDYAKAIQVAESFVNNNDSSNAYNLLGLAYAEKGDMASASKSFSKALKIAPGDPAANHNLAAIAISDNQYQTARSYYNEVIARNGLAYPTLIKLAALDQLEGDEKQLIEHLNQAINLRPNEVNPRLALTQLYLSRGETDKARQAFGELFESTRDNPSVIQTLGRIQLAQADFRSAEQSFKSLVNLAPNYAEGHFLLSQAYASTGKATQVLAELTSTLKLDPEHFLARLNMAQILVKQDKIEEAKEHLTTLQQLHPENVDLQYLRGIIARKEGNPIEAQQLFKKVYSSSNNSRSMLALAQQEWDLGEKDIAIARIESWLKEHKQDVFARIYLAKFLAMKGLTSKAIDQYEKLLEFAPENLIALNNLAWELRNSNPGKALKYAEQAYRLKSNDLQIADTLSVVLMKNQSLERALSVNDRITEGVEISQQPALFFHRAQILAALGRTDKSVDLLNRLLELSSEFPEKSDVKILLQSL